MVQCLSISAEGRYSEGVAREGEWGTGKGSLGESEGERGDACAGSECQSGEGIECSFISLLRAGGEEKGAERGEGGSGGADRNGGDGKGGGAAQLEKAREAVPIIFWSGEGYATGREGEGFFCGSRRERIFQCKSGAGGHFDWGRPDFLSFSLQIAIA